MYWNSILCLLLGACAGFVWGRRLGLATGEQLGRSSAPLELLAKTLEQGVCQICRRDLPGVGSDGSDDRGDD